MAGLLHGLSPHNLIRVIDWQDRFKAVGLGPLGAWRAALSSVSRSALASSRIELLPRALRHRLGTVVDIGANTGQWISALMRFVPIRRAEVFEPNPEVYAELHLRLGSRPGIHLHNEALGERPGIQLLHVTRGSTLSSLLPPSDMLKVWHGDRGEQVTQVPVSVRKLDEVIQADVVVDLLKVDVQGSERTVLKGGVETLKRTRALLIEMVFESHYEGDVTFWSLYDYITRDLRFKFWDMCPPERVDGRALWTDAAFVNPVMCPCE